MTLPYDIARCPGTTDPLCQQCRRREHGDEFQWYTAPAVLQSRCINYIPPITANSTSGD